MRFLPFLLFTLFLASCATPEVNRLAPPAVYVITEYLPSGAVARVHQTQSYSEWGYPPTITFQDATGRDRKISGSYLVELKVTP
jgi:hypothetical protein